MIGFIVDGPGDFAAFRARYTGVGKVLKTDGPRGQDVPAGTIIASAAKQVSMLRDLGCSSVVIVTDYEKRDVTYREFIRQLQFESSGVDFIIPVRIASPNTMIENWYLADLEGICKKHVFLKPGLRQKSYEGKHGKVELRRLFKKGYDYNEVLHGPKLFPKVRTKIAEEQSSSFRRFVAELQSCGVAPRNR